MLRLFTMFFVGLMMLTQTATAGGPNRSTYNSNAKIMSNNGSIYVVPQNGPPQQVNLQGVVVPPEKQAALNRYIQNTYRYGYNHNVHQTTNRYGESDLTVRGQNLNKELIRRGLAVPTRP